MINLNSINSTTKIFQKYNCENSIHHIEGSIKIYHNKINYDRFNIGFFKTDIEKNKLYLIINEIFNNENITKLLNDTLENSKYIMIGKDSSDLELYMELNNGDIKSYDIGKKQYKTYTFINPKNIIKIYENINKYLNENLFIIFTNIFMPFEDCKTIYKLDTSNHLFAYLFKLDSHQHIINKYTDLINFCKEINNINLDEIIKFLKFTNNAIISHIYLGYTMDNKLEFTIYFR
jgi:hypothetical protein